MTFTHCFRICRLNLLLADVVSVELDVQVNALATPDDRRLDLQWSIPSIRAEEAWNMTIGDKAPIVCVIDGGIDYNHADLRDNIHPLKGWNVMTQNYDPMDESGHGTHTAGIIGAVGNNGIGIAGVMWKAQLLACKFLDSTGAGTISGIIECLDFCVKNGATISSNSYGVQGLNKNNSILRDAIEAAAAKGHLFVAAAGNSGQDNDGNYRPIFPAAFNLPQQINVAATDSDGTLAPYSAYGAKSVHIAAPGTDILSTYPGDWLAYLSGTSMACPMVAGAAALLQSRADGRVSNERIREILLASASKSELLKNKVSTGGMLDLKAAMEALEIELEDSAFNVPIEGSPTAAPAPGPTSGTRRRRRIKRRQKIARVRARLEVEGSSCSEFLIDGREAFIQSIRSVTNLQSTPIKVTCGIALKGGYTTQLTITANVQTYTPLRTKFSIHQAVLDGSLAAEMDGRSDKYRILGYTLFKKGAPLRIIR